MCFVRVSRTVKPRWSSAGINGLIRGEVPSASNLKDFLTNSWRLSCDASTEIRVEKIADAAWIGILPTIDQPKTVLSALGPFDPSGG